MGALADELFLTKKASTTLVPMSDEQRNNVLLSLANLLHSSTTEILRANNKDLALMENSDQKYDRLLLSKERIDEMASDLVNVANLSSPLNKILDEKFPSNGLHIKKITVPLGVVAVIYEARPNVTIDVFSLCFKTANACVLKGGKDAYNTNLFLVSLIQEVLESFSIDANVCYLLPPMHELSLELLHATGLIDVCIPRGSQALINFVRENARVPIIETGAGIVHIYFDISADLAKGRAIIDNAKTRRVSVCNALDTLIIHKARLNDLPSLVKPLAEKNVEIFADPESYVILLQNYPKSLLKKATKTDFGHEFLAYKMAIKTVNSLNEALLHINDFSSKHSEAIITEDKFIADYFLAAVDAAAVYVNASTAFTDGGQFGLGAEIGISTQKLHARGPMGLDALTSYKWLIWGNGQIR